MTDNLEDNPYIKALAERFKKAEEEEREAEAQKKAEWDILPEDEKNRRIACREKAMREVEERNAREEQEERTKKWRDMGIPPRFYDATWENWKIESPEQEKVLEKVKQAWEKNLFIVGGNGTGKTHLAMCLVKDGATYRLMPELFRTVREDLNIEQETIKNLGGRKLLILDEAGRQKGTDFERNLLFEIIDTRWNNMLPTTIIGNIGKREFADLYGAAIIDRLRPETIEFTWKSKR
jgi:DNA replication protein DnaC